MSALTLKQFNDAIYQGLFQASGDQLRARLDLPAATDDDDEDLRDAMGIEALRALNDVEGAAATYMEQRPHLTRNHLFIYAAYRAGVVGDKLRAECLVKGVDPVTGLPASRNGVTH